MTLKQVWMNNFMPCNMQNWKHLSPNLDIGTLTRILNNGKSFDFDKGTKLPVSLYLITL